jgi:hypothetical protein
MWRIPGRWLVVAGDAEVERQLRQASTASDGIQKIDVTEDSMRIARDNRLASSTNRRSASPRSGTSGS